MMNQPLVSVIVPIYHVERYVGKCIESIIEQTYPNLEIILVDDGGQDACPKICELYSRKDQRIRVIHKLNGGLVSARKAGLARAQGEYILNVDGDDWIGPEYVETLVKEAVSRRIPLPLAKIWQTRCSGQCRHLWPAAGKPAEGTSPLFD